MGVHYRSFRCIVLNSATHHHTHTGNNSINTPPTEPHKIDATRTSNRMGGPLPDRLIGLLEPTRILSTEPAIEAALAAGDYAAFVAHLVVRRRSVASDVLVRVGEALAAAAGGSGGSGGEPPPVIPAAYVDLLKAAAGAAAGMYELLGVVCMCWKGRGTHIYTYIFIHTYTHTDGPLPSPAHVRTLLLTLTAGGSGSKDGGAERRAALARAIVGELQAWGQVRFVCGFFVCVCVLPPTHPTADAMRDPHTHPTMIYQSNDRRTHT